jgi:hypothetical protein
MIGGVPQVPDRILMQAQAENIARTPFGHLLAEDPPDQQDAGLGPQDRALSPPSTGRQPPFT